MSVEVERDAFLGAIRQVVDVVASKVTIPVLANVLLVAEAGAITATGTDLDLQASSRVEATGNLRVTVDAAKLAAAVTSFRSGKLKIAMIEGRDALTVKQGRGQRTLLTLAATDFPNRKPPEDPTSFAMYGPALARMLDAASIAQPSDTTRPYLNGIRLHRVDNRLRAAATDGNHLVRAEMVAPDGSEGLPDITIPTKAVTILRKLLAKYDGHAQLSATRTAFDIVIGSTSLRGALIDGTYPTYENIIPAPCDRNLCGARDAIIDAVRSVAAVVNAEGTLKTRAVRFLLGDGDDVHEVTARDTTGTSAAEPLDVEVSRGPFEFGVNHKYLVSVAGIFAESGKLTISLADGDAAMLITGEKDPDLVAIIQPMQL